MKKAAPTLTGRARPVVRALRSRPRTGVVPRALRIYRPGRAPVDMTLSGDERYIIGRHAAADIGFGRDDVSRLHGVLTFDDEMWTYRDLGSRNGSVVLRGGNAGAAESAPTEGSLSVHVGDIVELGGTETRVEFLYQREQSAAAKADPTACSDAAQAFDHLLTLAGHTRVPVFLIGPSGSGKTHSARTIHERSRGDGQLVPLNCARLPEDAAQLHSVLLGHKKGAFTGAVSDRDGKLVRAAGGTLFLDEVESLSARAQGFLLDVLEGSADISPLGAPEVTLAPPVFRLISASKRPLSDSGLRDDLCERLAEGHMWAVPSLSDRRDDIAGFVQAFADDAASQLGAGVTLTADFLSAAERAPWPGEIRQLKATVRVLTQLALAEHELAGGGAERPVLELTGAMLAQQLDERAHAFGDAGGVMRKTDTRTLTAAHIAAALSAHRGNKSAAARALGIARNTLIKKIRDYGI